MPSIWERLGEAAGYAIGAAIFGPGAAIARRERRVLRLAFHGWLDELDAERLRPRAKGTSRRSGWLRGAEPIPFEAELDPMSKSARVDVALALGRDVAIALAKGGSSLNVAATTLDADAASEIVNEIAGTQLGHLDIFMIDVRKDRVVLDVLAPSDVETWKRIEKALVVLVESWSRRWTTYR